MKPLIEITFLPLRYQAYFDWLLTGLGMLEQKGMLELKVHEPIWQKPLGFTFFGKLPMPRLMPRFWDQVCPIDYFCLTGKVRIQDRVMSFVVDATDSPFNFGLALLETTDLYFKCQCPSVFEREGFPLNSNVRIPYHSDVFTFANKIRPAMLGRPLARTTNLKRNLRVLKRWEEDLNFPKSTRIFASFGSDKAPAARTKDSAFPAPHNYESESTLLARWGNAVHHPNRKRGHVVEMLRSFGKSDISACLFNSSNPAIVGPRLNDDQYQNSLRKAAVNLNISGFRRSLPFRFMDTFLSGGMVATDTLAIKWYAPFEFGVEVAEIGDLGYELEDKVNYSIIKDRLSAIYDEQGSRGNSKAEAVQSAYKRKWAPGTFAEYFVGECVKTL